MNHPALLPKTAFLMLLLLASIYYVNSQDSVHFILIIDNNEYKLFWHLNVWKINILEVGMHYVAIMKSYFQI